MEISIIILCYELCNNKIISCNVVANLDISSKLSISKKKLFVFYKRTSNDDKIEFFRKYSSNEYEMNSYTE